MKPIYFSTFVIVALSVSVVRAQNRKADSLHTMLNNTMNDSMRVRLLSEICEEFMVTDTANARIYCDRMLKSANETASSFEKAVAYRTAGTYFNTAAQYGRSLDFYRKALDLFGKLPGRVAVLAYGETLSSYASVFHHRGDFETALVLYLEADSILSRYNEYSARLILYNDISDIYLKLMRTDKSMDYVARINSIIDSVSDPVVKSRFYISHANMLVYQGKYDEAAGYFEMARKIAEPERKYNVLTNWAYNYGFMLSQQKKYDEALAYYTRSMNYARIFGSRYDECDALYKVGLMHYYCRRFEKADSILRNALTFAEHINSKILVRNVLDALTYMEADRKHYRAAYGYLQRYVDTADELFTQSDQRQVDFLNAKYEAAERQATIKRLTDERKIQALEIEKRKTVTYYLSITLALVLLSALLVQQYYRARRKMIEQNSQIQTQRIKELEREKQLAAVQYALQGEENERSRLARDLHDGLGGLLSGAKMSFSSFRENYLRDCEGVENFKHAFDLLGKSIGELQRVAHNMMPQALVSGSIKDAVSEFCERMNGSDSLSVKFRFFGREDKVAQKYQIAVYRVVQELISNVVKHSGASEALVQLVQESGRISVVVQDDGRGFDPLKAQTSEGHGLKNIRTRIESLGGRLFVDSSAGKGTEVSFEFENLRYGKES